MRTLSTTVLLIAALAATACFHATKEEDDGGDDSSTAGAASGGGSAGSGGSVDAGATGGSTGAASGSGGGGAFETLRDPVLPQDIKPCAGTPVLGAACTTPNEMCQTTDGTCASVFTCQDDVWYQIQNCAGPVLDCTAYPPLSNDACSKPGTSCRYAGTCGAMTSECKEGVWSQTWAPLLECESLCTTMCSQLTTCGVAWAPQCLDKCRQAHVCAAPTQDGMVALCQAQATKIAGLTCPALCDEATHGSLGLGDETCPAM